MAGISGKNGKIVVGSTDVAECTKWSFTPKSDNPSWASCDSNGFKQRVDGVKDGSGSIEGKFDPADPIWDLITEGSAVTLKLYLNATVFIIVPAVIGDMSLETDIDSGDVVGWTASFETNGAWTYPA